ncbi:MAG: tetratricopeptide repeat protein, partial [Blastocatellia bacterium]
MAQTADDVRSLEPGKRVERLLAGGETHSYRITLAAGQFSHAVVNQRGIDLVVAFYGVDGRKLVEIDDPNDVYGPEPISWIAETSGSYRLEVRSFSTDAPAGRYEVRVEELRTAAPQDERRVAAQKAFTDAKSLRNLRTAESQRDSIEKYKQALLLWKSLADRLMAAYSLHEMGFIYGDVGEYQKALDSYAQARDIYKAMGDLWGEGGVLNNIGWVYGALGEHQKAIDFYAQSLQASRATGLPHDESRLLNNIGAEHASLGEYQKALDIHLRLLAVRQARNDSRGQAITLNNIAKCYEHLGEKQKALDYYGKALIRMPAVGDAFYTAATLNNIGALYRDLGEQQKALDYLNQALVLRRTVGDRNGEAATLAAIARLERDRGNLVEALNSIGAALTAVETLRTNVASQQLRASFFASVARYREFNIDLLMRRHKQHPTEGFDAAALEASEKGRARSLLELLAEASAEIRQGVDPALLERERTLRQTISDKADGQMHLLRGKHTEEQATAVSREID